MSEVCKVYPLNSDPVFHSNLSENLFRVQRTDFANLHFQIKTIGIRWNTQNILLSKFQRIWWWGNRFLKSLQSVATISTICAVLPGQIQTELTSDYSRLIIHREINCQHAFWHLLHRLVMPSNIFYIIPSSYSQTIIGTRPPQNRQKFGL